MRIHVRPQCLSRQSALGRTRIAKRSETGANAPLSLPLAARAEVRTAVHECVAHNRGAAARARLGFSAIGIQGVRKVACLPVDVDVLGVEARAAFGECFL